jgi:hypothetical protein
MTQREMTQRSGGDASTMLHWFAGMPRWQRELLSTLSIVVGTFAFVVVVGFVGLALIYFR